MEFEEKSGPGFSWEKIRGPLFFWRKLPQYIRRVCRFVLFFFWIQWGCKVKLWKKLRGRSFIGASKSILVGSTHPSQVALVPVKVWWVPPPIFLGLVVSFFQTKALAQLGIFFFPRSALPCRPVCGNLPGVVPGYENKQLYLEDEAVPPLKILGWLDHLWKTGCFGTPRV